MSRTFAIAAILSLSTALGAAGARADDSLAARVHAAAVKSCAVEASDSFPASHYGAITSTCVRRISSAAMRNYAIEADLRMKSSTAFNTATK